MASERLSARHQQPENERRPNVLAICEMRQSDDAGYERRVNCGSQVLRKEVSGSPSHHQSQCSPWESQPRKRELTRILKRIHQPDNRKAFGDVVSVLQNCVSDTRKQAPITDECHPLETVRFS